MSFKDPYFQKYSQRPYPEVDFIVANDQSFIIKSPWLELHGDIHPIRQSIIRQVENEWRNHSSDAVSEFLSHLSRWPICYLDDSNHVDDIDSISPIAAFSTLRREYLITRLETWKNVSPDSLDANRMFATHYHFIRGAERVLDNAARIYGPFHEPVRIFRDQELGHWRLIKSDADQIDLVDIEPSKIAGRLLAAFDEGTRESFFKFCLFAAICEGAISNGARIGHPNYLADAVERHFGPNMANGARLHGKINRDLSHETVAFDFLSCANDLTPDQFAKSRGFMFEIATLQNEILIDLTASRAACQT